MDKENQDDVAVSGQENMLPLSAKGMNPETAHDYGCDFPGCEAHATGYLFMRQQFCDLHRHAYVR